MRGEVMFLKKDFAALNEKQREAGLRCTSTPATQPAARSSKRLAHHRRPPLTAFLYNIVAIEGVPMPPTQWESLGYLRALGFVIPPQAQHYPTLSDIIQQIPAWITHRNPLEFEIDGVVMKVNALRLADELGLRAKTHAARPRISSHPKKPPPV